jgi:DNA repair exonuclease SbcCD ATPase subunit
VNAREKIAWLKGLFEGMEFSGREAKIYSALTETLDALSSEMDALQRQYENLQDTCDTLQEEMVDLEESLGVYGYEEDKGDEEEEEGFSENYVAATCPACANTFFFNQKEVAEEALVCPECGKQFDWEPLPE